MTEELLKRLEAVALNETAHWGSFKEPAVDVPVSLLTEAAALIRQLKADNERMREALEPFAADHECDGHATVKDFDLEVAVQVKYSAVLAARRAAQSLNQTERGSS